MKIKLLLIFLVMIFSNHFVNAQDSIVNTNPIDYTQPKDYILAEKQSTIENIYSFLSM